LTDDPGQVGGLLAALIIALSFQGFSSLNVKRRI